MNENIWICCGLLVLTFLFFGVISLCAYFFIREIIATRYKLSSVTLLKMKACFIALTIFLSVYFSYTAVYPTNDFYFDEFTTVTLQPTPKSANIITKSATYPDFHGDYSSDSTIALSSKDFQNLLNTICHNNQFTKLPVNQDKQLASFQRKEINHEDQMLFITFFTDNKTINVHIDMN